MQVSHEIEQVPIELRLKSAQIARTSYMGAWPKARETGLGQFCLLPGVE
jgi:hypothetical protein